MNQKEIYEKKAEARLNEWSAEIDKLKAKAEQADADAKIALSEKVDAALAKKNDAEKKVNELKSASDDAWDDVKVGLENAWTSLDTAFQAAKSRFSSRESA